MILVFEDFSLLPPAEWSDRADELLHKACPKKLDQPYFERHMQIAERLGLTWIEAVQYVIQRRRELN